ncbi:MAG TPA: rRNA maturation RNase YbeY [Gemmatimonadales bacterium]|nr:rRNA maturation RNase YbeY [Gemmatimonadales bacterium]
MSGRHRPLSRSAVVGVADRVLRSERSRALLSITFVGPDRIRMLNQRWRGKPLVTDVLAFPLSSPRGLAGDIYICRWQGARQAAVHGVSLREELIRLIVHGILHVLGRVHPEGPARLASSMWQRQERLVRALR